MGKNAFELRWEILKEARQILYENWYARGDRVQVDDTRNCAGPPTTDPPTFEEIRELALKMYEFVQKKGITDV